MRNIRLRLAYDGTAYAGWQVQPHARTIQSVVEDAIEALTGEPVRVLSAGRTDSGVHALGQVVSFRSDFNIPPPKWRPALQSKLPDDVVILESDQVPADFHATYSARSKRYRYVIYNNLVDSPFVRRYAWRISQPLRVSLMQTAAQLLIGRHDFRSFESDWPNKATSVRTVHELTIRRHFGWDLWTPVTFGPKSTDKEAQTTGQPPVAVSEDSAPFICLEIEADGFLYNMVRAITGTLVNVGRETWSPEDVERVLHAQDRQVAGATAPACGLFLAGVRYDV